MAANLFYITQKMCDIFIQLGEIAYCEFAYFLNICTFSSYYMTSSNLQKESSHNNKVK